MPGERRRRATAKSRSTLALAAGALLVLVGGVLVVLATRQDSGTAPAPPGPRAPRAGTVTPARPCPRQGLQPSSGRLKGHGGAADRDGVLRPSTRRIAATALTVAAAGAGAAAPSQADAARAQSADGFVDSIGVNVHLGYNDTPYRRHDVIQRKLTRLGVRHIRDGLFPHRPEMYQAFRSLARCGIKTDLIVGDPLRRWTIGPLSSQLNLIKTESLGAAVESLEGPNEYDNQGDKNWKPVLRDYQRRLYREVKADPELKRYPVLGPSLVDSRSYARLGDISGSLDYGNIHPYPGGEKPEGRNADLDRQLGWARRNSRSKRVQVTETGYHNGLRSASTHLPATERAAGTYMPRVFLEDYRRGVSSTYSYELVDTRPDPGRVNAEANFGLLRNDYSEKPAYAAIRRTIDLLSDPGPRFRPSRLRYSVSGARSGVRRMLLQKRDGSFYLALWRDESVWDPGSRKAVRASSRTVRISLGRHASRIKVYRPSRSGKALQTASHTRSVSLKASPSVAIVKISPRRARAQRR